MSGRICTRHETAVISKIKQILMEFSKRKSLSRRAIRSSFSQIIPLQKPILVATSSAIQIAKTIGNSGVLKDFKDALQSFETLAEGILNLTIKKKKKQIMDYVAIILNITCTIEIKTQK